MRRAPFSGPGAVTIVLTAGLAAVGAGGPASAAQSQAMSQECRAVAADTAESRQRAERWVQERLAAFLPSADQALRMRALEMQAQQTLLAFGSISSTCAQYLDGRIGRELADTSLQGFEQTIRNFLHDVGNEVFVVASAGQVADIPSIRKTLTEVGAVGRQAALLGEETIAEESHRTLVRTLVAFSRTFVDSSCWSQAFDDELVFGIDRQNQTLGTGIDVMPCAQRYFETLVSPVTFESCSIRGVGTWRVAWITHLPGLTTGGVAQFEATYDGTRATGNYSVDWGKDGVDYRASGAMALERRTGGAGARATYSLSGDIDVRLVRGKEKIRKLEQLMGQQTKPGFATFTVDVRVSETPCKELPPLRSLQLPTMMFPVPQN